MPCNYPLNQTQYKLPGTLVKSYQVFADGKLVIEENNNYQRLRKHPLEIAAQRIDIVLKESHNNEECRIFAVDLV